MGYSKQHIEQVRQNILDEANRCFRLKGFHKTSVNQIMENIGLTHGGFYAHFQSKEDLFCQAMGQDLNFSKIAEQLMTQTEPGNAIATAINYYLNIENRDQVGNACSMVTLCPEVARMSEQAKQQFSHSFKTLVEHFSKATGSESDAISALALCVGGLTLARAMDDEAEAEKLLKACMASSLSLVSSHNEVS